MPNGKWKVAVDLKLFLAPIGAEAQRLQKPPRRFAAMGIPSMDNITSLLGTFLDVQSRRAEVVAGNLANADTPGFVAKELDFADFLRHAANESLAPSAVNKPAGGEARIIDQEASTIGLDGNTVDPGREMATLAEAGMKYLEGTQLLQMRLRTLRSAIREGK